MFFEKHVFCCINKRPESKPKSCCSLKNSEKMQIELKKKIKDLKLNKKISSNLLLDGNRSLQKKIKLEQIRKETN